MVKSMDEYFYVLTAINVFVLAFMSILVNISETLNSKPVSYTHLRGLQFK